MRSRAVKTLIKSLKHQSLDKGWEDIDADFIIVSRRLYSDLPLALNHSQNIIYKNNDIFILKKSEPRQFYKI